MIGYVSVYKKPTKFIELIATICEYKSIGFVYIHYSDIRINENLEGKMLSNGKWIKVNIPLPRFIEISPYCFNRMPKKRLDYLRENTTLSDTGRRRYNKMTFQRKLTEDGTFKNYTIPSRIAENFEVLVDFLNLYSTAILKPLDGQFGIGVFKIVKNEENIQVITEEKVRNLDKEEFRSFLETEIESNKYIIQKLITSQTKQGYPFDCRINVNKNGNGNWEVARQFIRIGIGQKIVSNISQGGGVSDIDPFLDEHFMGLQDKIKEQLDYLGTNLPLKVEELRNMELMQMGIDVGISQEGELYIFETNSSPGTSQLRDRAAFLKADYYEYMLNRITGKVGVQ